MPIPPLNGPTFRDSLRYFFIFYGVGILLLAIKALAHVGAKYDNCLNNIDHRKLCDMKEMSTMFSNISNYVTYKVASIYEETDWLLVGFLMCFLEIHVIFIMTIRDSVVKMCASNTKSFAKLEDNLEIPGSAKVIEATDALGQLSQDEQTAKKTFTVRVALPSTLISKVSGDDNIIENMDIFITECLVFLDLKAQPFDIAEVKINDIIYELKLKHKGTVVDVPAAVSEADSSDAGEASLDESAAHVYPVSGGIHNDSQTPATNGTLTETDASMSSSRWSESTRSDENDPNWRNGLTL